MSFYTHHFVDITFYKPSRVSSQRASRIFIRYDYLKFGVVTLSGSAMTRRPMLISRGFFYTTDCNYAAADHYSTKNVRETFVKLRRVSKI